MHCNGISCCRLLAFHGHYTASSWHWCHFMGVGLFIELSFDNDRLIPGYVSRTAHRCFVITVQCNRSTTYTYTVSNQFIAIICFCLNLYLSIVLLCYSNVTTCIGLLQKCSCISVNSRYKHIFFRHGKSIGIRSCLIRSDAPAICICYRQPIQLISVIRLYRKCNQCSFIRIHIIWTYASTYTGGYWQSAVICLIISWRRHFIRYIQIFIELLECIIQISQRIACCICIIHNARQHIQNTFHTVCQTVDLINIIVCKAGQSVG